MAGTGKRDDDDNILAQLLPTENNAIIPFDFVEEDEEEVNYSGSDEDFLSVELPVRSRGHGSTQEDRWATSRADHLMPGRNLAARTTGCSWVIVGRTSSEQAREPCAATVPSCVWASWRATCSLMSASSLFGCQSGVPKTRGPTRAPFAHWARISCARRQEQV